MLVKEAVKLVLGKQALISHLLNKQDKIIIKSLFKHFVQDAIDAKHVNEMIAKIIRKREKIIHQEPIQHRLDTIPEVSIAYIGSFLDPHNYNNLCFPIDQYISAAIYQICCKN